MLSEFEQTLADFIKTNGLLANTEKVLSAVSGGCDSVALVFALNRLAEEAVIKTKPVTAHVNHNLRGQASRQDQEFVEKFGKKLGISVLAKSVDVKAFAKENHLSIETAARELRRQALIEMANEAGSGAVATGHHADDNAETMIHRLMRGTGFRGLCGIRPKSVFDGIVFIRPLLCFTRKEIVEYCRQNNLAWQSDHTNDEFAYTRNRIRHLIIPEIQKL